MGRRPERGEWSKASALAAIAQAQVQAGQPEQAVRTAGLLLTERNRLLLDIGARLAEAKDRTHFKDLLVPCAYYLDAALRMSGLLAQLYLTWNLMNC